MRVRFAPSPTGYLHVGNARTVLFNYLHARRHNGQFVLRIEDTDKERSKPEYIQQIYKDLAWLGIDWDEGPDRGGPYAPYLQSERVSLHQDYAKKLIDEGHAYYCYCTQQELEARRQAHKDSGQAVVGYDNRCRTLTEDEIAAKHAAGIVPSVRFKMTCDESLVVDDVIRGEVTFDMKLQSDFIILRPDGSPTFHLAVAIDDGMMKITHVLRGEDHLSNTPKHIMIMRACGFDVPQYAHMPLLMGPNGEPLSKRCGAMSIAEYRTLGYRSESLCNFMALLGWNPGDEREIFSMEELKQIFSLKRVSKSPAVFNKEKLDWVAGMHIRALEPEEYVREATRFIVEAGIVAPEEYNARPEWFGQVVQVFKDYIACYDDLRAKIRFFLTDEQIQFTHAALATDAAKSVIAAAIAALEAVEYLDETTFDAFFKEVKTQSKQKGKDLYVPVRFATTGEEHGPDMKKVMILLGKKVCLARLKKALGK